MEWTSEVLDEVEHISSGDTSLRGDVTDNGVASSDYDAEEESDDGGEEPSSSDRASEYISQLHRLEDAVLKLLDIASDTMESVAAESNSVEPIAEAYYTLLDKVQYGMRNIVNSMVQDGLLLQSETQEVVLIPWSTTRNYITRLKQ